MTIETKFDFKQEVFFIYRDKIIKLPVQGISYERGRVTYTFCVRKSERLADDDENTIQKEENCFASIDELCQHFKAIL